VDRTEAALGVWQAARTSSGSEPDSQRIRRVREKLVDPTAELFVVERGGDMVGMALAEPFRQRDGKGTVRPGWGHLSMVFVHPGYQGVGIGTELLQRLIEDARWTHLSVWTRETNTRAQRLYRGSGFLPTGELGSIGDGVLTQRWERLGQESSVSGT
jgi:ribosomal protein S18 acetylase RimI-like enzyme